MTRLAILAVAASLGAVACTDDPERAAAPTAPIAPSMSRAAVVAQQRTTVCLSYLRKRSRLEVRLAARPTDTTLLKEMGSYDRMLVDACR
jgi:hypothetical protein